MQTDIQTDEYADNNYADIQIHRLTDRQADGQTDICKYYLSPAPSASARPLAVPVRCQNKAGGRP